MKNLFVAILLFAAAVVSSGQTQPAVSAKPNSVSRTTKAVHYRLDGGSIKTGFRGTELMSQASGEAKIEGKKTNIQIDAKFEGMEDASKFGLEYLTYVLWAVSPQGRAVNLGEVVLEQGKGRVKAYTGLQTFGMIVTAEPYFAVTQPGNIVVLENQVQAGMGAETIDATYGLLGRGTYTSTNTPIQGAIFGIDSRTPMQLFEARNALRIAHIAAGDKYATSILAKADQQLSRAEDAYRQGRGRPAIEAAAKEATETAEEARVMAVKQKAEEEAQAEAAAREAKARAEAEAEARRRAEAEAARAEAERMKQEAEQAAQEAARQREEAEKAKAEALAQQQALAAETEKARQAAQESEKLRQQAEKEKQELRARLLQQLNTILATRDTARGLIANMSDVLFKSGSFELLPGARERLAKVSGIVLAYPGLHLEVEGHTDSIGSDEYNQSLSERRAEAVRDYLVQQGIVSDAIVSRGLGKSEPVASNDTPEGRQQNRRVEIVLSGDAIGARAEDQAQAGSGQLQR
ncbi:MAG TPA: OmpA family protein [Terriglobales bacterium]|jgi:outer membrane protein OmpA-like peptidoglycan-associated protein|nr:OmpA family protein [Terriglobales bacterium]